jgi:hypothetical protein
MPTVITRGFGYDEPTVILRKVASKLVAEVRVADYVLGVVVPEEMPSATVRSAPALVFGTVEAVVPVAATVRAIQYILGILKEEGPLMAIETNRIDMFIRDNRDLMVTVTTDDGDPEDLTDASVWFTVKQKLSDTDTDALIQKKNTEAGGDPTQITMTNPTGGQCEVHLVPADTEDMNPGTYHYDIQVKLASGKIYTVARDRITFKEDVTRSS